MLEIILPLIEAILTAVLSYVGIKIKAAYEKHINTKEKEAVVTAVVQCVEQISKDLHGKEKLEKAKALAIDWLNEKGIKISDAELTILIESSVNALNGGFYNTID